MENWQKCNYAYLAKRKNRLFLNVLIEDVNSVYRVKGHNWILSNLIVENGEVTIKYSEFNNEEKISLTEEQKLITTEYALEILKKYF